MPAAKSSKTDIILKVIGLMMAAFLAILGIYAKQNIDLQESRLQHMSRDIERLEDRFENCRTCGQKNYDELLRETSSNKARIEMLMKQK